MKKFAQVIIITHFLALLSLVFAEIEIITVQQGLDGYAGCRDTYITDTLEAPPRGDSEELVLQGYH